MVANNSPDRAAFSARIASSSHDAAALATIEAELRGISATWARSMRLQVIDLKRKLSAQPTHWGARFALPPPDGRPLYRYRLRNEAFENLAEHLRVRVGPSGFRMPHEEALFVLWAAEWFRRHYSGGMLRWGDLGQQLGLALAQAEWRRLADDGLEIWKVPPLRLHGATQRLLNLARQGGFPLAAFARESGGWVGPYLQRLVGALLAVPDPTTTLAFDNAERLSEMVRESWRSKDFLLVGADLALTVVKLRREAQAGSAVAGLPASAWLDVNRPNWRDELPLVVEDAAGRGLIDGLMTAAVVRGVSNVRAVRQLRRTACGWQPELRLELNGALPNVDLDGLRATWSRLRMFAGGALARHVPGELAIVEPADDAWVGVGTNASARWFQVPLDVPVDVELRGGAQRVVPPFRIPNGQPATSRLLICEPTIDETIAQPQQLIVAGTASGKYRADPLFVFAPSGWILAPEGEGATTTQLESSGESWLWRVDGGAIAASTVGDRYLILAGQTSDQRDRLTLEGETAEHCKAAFSPLQVLRGRPELILHDHGHRRGPRRAEAWWRRQGERTWKSMDTFVGLGHCEFAWRDQQTGHLRDRADAIVVPAAFRIDVQKRGEQVDLGVRGWPGSIDVQPGLPTEGRGWVFRTNGAREAIASISLSGYGSGAAQLEVRLPHQPWITDWEGCPLDRGVGFSLSDMHRLVARADGHAQLMGRLRDRNRKCVEQAERRWLFDTELPLNSIRDDVAALLRPLGELDAQVEFNFAGERECNWYACEFDVKLDNNSRGFIPTKVISEEKARIVGRALSDFPVEVDFGPFGLVQQSTRQPIDLPKLTGTWLIYIRADARILTRPHLAVCQHDGVPQDPLGRAMLIDDKSERMDALTAMCADAEAADVSGHRIVRSLIDLTASLRGLPPATIDILQIASARPLLAAKLMFEATNGEIESVAALNEGLPFAWPLIAKRHWDAAAEFYYSSLYEALGTFPENQRIQFAAEAIAMARRRIREIEPALATALGQSIPGVSLADAAQNFMRLWHDQPQVSSRSPFRPRHAALLPQWTFSGIFWSALDAPCAAALAASEKISLNEAETRCVKDVARRYTRYFEEAFAAAAKDIAHGRRIGV